MCRLTLFCKAPYASPRGIDQTFSSEIEPCPSYLIRKARSARLKEFVLSVFRKLKILCYLFCYLTRSTGPTEFP